MESLFGCNSGGGSGKKQDNGKSAVPPPEKRVLDPNKSQNIAILLKALNVTQEEVSRGLLQGNRHFLCFYWTHKNGNFKHFFGLVDQGIKTV